MARGSPSDRKRQRALDELAGFDKAIRRGQRPAPLTVVDTYLELPVADRPAHVALVQRLVGKAIDEFQTRPPPPPVLTSWCQRLEAAPELVTSAAEPAELALERWWTLIRICLGRRLFAMAERLWAFLASATRERAPAFAELIDVWLERGAAGPPDELLERLQAPLAALVAKGSTQVGASGSGTDPVERDPRLGVEPTARPRASLGADADRDGVRAWVETAFLERSGVLSRLRLAARGLSRDRHGWLWAEAAPLLLREALARDNVELASGFAEALSHTAEPFAAELEIALRWSFALWREHSSLFPRFALLTLDRDPSSFERITSALFTLGIEHRYFTPELVALLLALLRREKPTAKLWLWAIVLIPPDSEVDHDALTKELLAALPSFIETPGLVAEALARMDQKDAALAIDFISCFAELPALEGFVRALWPRANEQLRAPLAEAFDALCERHDMRARPTLDGSRKLIPQDLAADLEDLLAEGFSAEDAVAALLEEVPPPIAVVLRKPLLELARQGPPPPSEASRALWNDLGVDIVAADPERLGDALDYVKEEAARRRLIESAYAEHQTVEGWIRQGHRLAMHIQDSHFTNLFMGMVGERFGNGTETWRLAHATQDRCDCLYSLAIGLRLLLASLTEGVADAKLIREVRAIFPYPYAQERIDQLLGHFEFRTKRPPSRSKSNRAKAAPDKSKAKAESKAPKPKKAEDAKPKPKKAESKAPKPKKAEDAKPKPKKAEDAKPKPKKAEDAKPKPKKADGPKSASETAPSKPAAKKPEKADNAKSATGRANPNAKKAAKATTERAKERRQHMAEMGKVIRDLFDID